MLKWILVSWAGIPISWPLSPALRCASADCCPHFHWRPKCAGSRGTLHKLCNSIGVFVQIIVAALDIYGYLSSVIITIWIFELNCGQTSKLPSTKNKTQLNFKFHYFFPRNLKATPLIMANILLLKKVTRFVLALCSDRSKWVKFLTSVETVSAPLQKLKDISKGSRETKKMHIFA